VNAGKRSRTNPEGAASRASIKRPRRGEVNFLPNYPHGESQQTLETQRLAIVEQFKRTSMERDIMSIHHHMQRTFALRREEIVNLAPPVAELKDRWPALFCEAQVSIKLKICIYHQSSLICYVCLSENVSKAQCYNITLLLFFMQLYSEFHRITNQNLPSALFAALDKYTPQLLKLYKKKRTGSLGQKMESIMMAFEEQVFFFILHITLMLNVNSEH